MTKFKAEFDEDAAELAASEADTGDYYYNQNTFVSGCEWQHSRDKAMIEKLLALIQVADKVLSHDLYVTRWTEAKKEAGL